MEWAKGPSTYVIPGKRGLPKEEVVGTVAAKEEEAPKIKDPDPMVRVQAEGNLEIPEKVANKDLVATGGKGDSRAKAGIGTKDKVDSRVKVGTRDKGAPKAKVEIGTKGKVAQRVVEEITNREDLL